MGAARIASRGPMATAQRAESPDVPMHAMHLRRPLPFILLLAASTHCLATGIEDMRSNGAVQGLYEIREAARDFVARQNATGGVIWQAGEPNLKVFVPRCAVDLQARWETIRWPSSGKGAEPAQHTRRVIAVSCARSVDRPPKWDVHVPVSTASASRAAPK
jgi:hypothetical protein